MSEVSKGKGTQEVVGVGSGNSLYVFFYIIFVALTHRKRHSGKPGRGHHGETSSSDLSGMTRGA